jgi:L-ascorbate metabolism protein UlaG (beta-lactamase superfamily)
MFRTRYALRGMRIATASILAVLAACTTKSATTTPARAQPAAPIELTYLGVAGFQISAAGKTVLVDPYFSRPDFSDGNARIVPDAAAIAKHAPATADLVAIAHSHVDHLLDAPEVAKRTGAQLMGSDSTVRVGKASGVADDKLIQIKGGEDYAFDGFSVRVIPSLHSAISDKHAVHRAIAEPVTLPLTFSQYEEGGSFAYYVRVGGHEVYVQSSANFIEREVTGLRPTIAVIAGGLREHIHDYTCRLLTALGKPPIVIATHFDDWQKPAPGGPYDLSNYAKEVEACAPGTRFIVPKHFEAMRF